MTVDLAPASAAPRTVWTAVCRVGDLAPERGAAALVNGEQVALFRLVAGAAGSHETAGTGTGPGTAPTVLAVQQRDPYSGAHVISRGIVGSRGDAPTVASPMYKQVFDLRTGRCLDGVGREPQHLRTWEVRIEGDVVLVGAAREPGSRHGEPGGGAAGDGGAR